MTEFAPVSKTFTSSVASCEYEFVCEDRGVTVLVEIGEPAHDVETVDGHDWRCPVRFTYEGTTINSYACGVDSFQALRLAVNRVVNRELVDLAKQMNAKIQLFGEECNLSDLSV